MPSGEVERGEQQVDELDADEGYDDAAAAENEEVATEHGSGTRGALTTFSIANDVAKYFAIIPAMFVASFPGLAALNVMGLHSPASAILSAGIFNAVVIVLLIPLALRGVHYRPAAASALLGRNLLIYGVGGIIAPFIGIKLIDLVVSLLPGF